MDELKELVIYRGYKATLDVSVAQQDIDPSELSAVIYFPCSGEKFAGTPEAGVASGDVTFIWDASLTAKMPAGTGNIEFHGADELYEIRKDFVKVQKASPADGKAVEVSQEQQTE